MLEYLRNAADKPVAKFLMGILIFSFVGWGVAEWVFGFSSNDTTLLRVGGQKVSIQQYNNQKSLDLANMSRDEQRAVYTDPVVANQFQTNIIKKLTTQKMVENHAKHLGYVVSDREIAQQIREMPEFQQNGKFSPVMFDVILQNSGYSESGFADVLRGQVMRTMVLMPMAIVPNVPKFATTAAYNARYGERTIEYATVKYSDYKVGTPSEEDLRQYYAQNPERIPETRDVSYVMVPAEMDKPDEYEAKLKIAQKLEDDIIAGEKFADAAKKNNAKYVTYKNVSAKNIPADKMFDNTILARIFDMPSDTESELIETKSGFVILRIDDIVAEHNAEFESVKSNLMGGWQQNEQRKQAYVRANEILTAANQAGKIQNAKTAVVSRMSGAPTDVLVAAFKNAPGKNSIVNGDKEFYVLRVLDEKAPKVDAKKYQDLSTEVSNMSIRHIQEDYDSYMKRKYPVKLNEKTYNRYVK